ncbi:MAG: fibronectin type III domain-containing protein [Candidatus Cryptobacteroides sp.]
MKPHTTAFLASILLLVTVPDAGAYHRVRRDIKYGPWVTEVSETGATVLWLTEDNTLDRVEMEGFEYFQTSDGHKCYGTMHSVRIDSLKPGKEYVYRLVGQQVTEDIEEEQIESQPREFSNWYSFKTLDSSADSCRFAMVNDLYSDKEMAYLLTADIKNRDFDFIMLGGNIVSSEDCSDDFLASAVTTLSDAAEWTPVFFTRGDEETKGCCPDCLAELFPTPTEGFWQSIRQGPAAILILDAAEGCTDEYISMELQWLEQAMRDPLFSDAPFKVAVMHLPSTDERLMSILEGAGLDLMIASQNQQYSELKAGEKGNPFPVIFNSGEERLDFRAGKHKIRISFNNAAGQTVHYFEIKKK